MRSARALLYFSQLSPVAQGDVMRRMKDVAASEGFISTAAKSSEVFRDIRKEEAQQNFEQDVRNGHIKSLALENGLRDASTPQEAEEIVRSVMGPVPMWRDDQLKGKLDLERHYKSPAYKELHQRYIPQSGMGLYGGEPGFEGSPRMHVDPDRPHVPSVHVSDRINGTLRYAKYGHMKHELNIIDVDKLIRHGRRLPPPEKLYFDLRIARRALSDANCSALVRFQRQRIQDRALIGQRQGLLRIAKEMFEQMLVVTIPPADAGVETHAEMIRCSSLCGEFNDAVRRRAIKQMERHPERFVLSSNFFDAVLEACVMCNRISDGLDTFYQLLAVNLRPLQTSLDHVLALLAQSMMPLDDSKLTSLLLTHGEDVGVQVDYISKMFERTTGAIQGGDGVMKPVDGGDSGEVGDIEELPSFTGVMDKVDEMWALYEFFGYTPSSTSIRAYLKCLALARLPDQVRLVLEYAGKHSIPIDEEGYLWVMFAFRPSDAGPSNDSPTLDIAVVSDFYASMRSTGMAPDHRHHQVALMVFAMCNDGESALALLHQHVLPNLGVMQADMTTNSIVEHLSAEMKMYALYAFARHPIAGSVRGVGGESDESVEAGDTQQQSGNEALFNMMKASALQLMRHSEDNRAVLSVDQQLFETFSLLCSKCQGAASDAFSTIKAVISTGCVLTPRMLNHMLLSNANSSGAEGGSRHLTEDLLGLYTSTYNAEGLPTQQTFMALGAAVERHGMTTKIEQLRDQLLHRATAYAIHTNEEVGDRLRAAEADTNKSSADGGVQLSDDDIAAVVGALPADAELKVPVIPVHLMRRHFVPNNIRKRDMDLRKYSQRLVRSIDKPKNISGSQAMRSLNEFEHSRDSMTMNV